MSSKRARQWVGLAAWWLAAFDLTLVACSEERPPGAGSSSGDFPIDAGLRDATTPTNEGGGAVTENDGGLDAATDIDAETIVDAGVDTGPTFQCLGDAPLPDAGTTAACTDVPSCSAHCDHFRANFKLAVAQEAVLCLRKLGSCNNQNDVLNCADKAIDKACPDSAVIKPYCSSLAPRCDPNASPETGGFDVATCELVAKGFSSAGRAVFESCADNGVDAGTCPSVIASCIEQIRL